MANKSYKTTSWGRRYADVVICPVRKLEFFVTPGKTKRAPWHYQVSDEHGNHLGEFNHPAVDDSGKHRSINSTEFWNKVEAIASSERP